MNRSLFASDFSAVGKPREPVFCRMQPESFLTPKRCFVAGRNSRLLRQKLFDVEELLFSKRNHTDMHLWTASLCSCDNKVPPLFLRQQSSTIYQCVSAWVRNWCAGLESRSKDEFITLLKDIVWFFCGLFCFCSLCIYFLPF